MFQTALRYFIASLLILSAACDTLGIEVRLFCGCLAAPSLSEALVGASRLSCVSSTQSPSIHLSSELDVGRDLLKGCSSAVLEAGALCAGRQPYRLYAEPSSACTSYFWCAPGRGACLLTCAAGGCRRGIVGYHCVRSTIPPQQPPAADVGRCWLLSCMPPHPDSTAQVPQHP